MLGAMHHEIVLVPSDNYFNLVPSFVVGEFILKRKPEGNKSVQGEDKLFSEGYNHNTGSSNMS